MKPDARANVTLAPVMTVAPSWGDIQNLGEMICAKADRKEANVSETGRGEPYPTCALSAETQSIDAPLCGTAVALTACFAAFSYPESTPPSVIVGWAA